MKLGRDKDRFGVRLGRDFSMYPIIGDTEKSIRAQNLRRVGTQEEFERERSHAQEERFFKFQAEKREEMKRLEETGRIAIDQSRYRPSREARITRSPGVGPYDLDEARDQFVAQQSCDPQQFKERMRALSERSGRCYREELSSCRSGLDGVQSCRCPKCDPVTASASAASAAALTYDCGGTYDLDGAHDRNAALLQQVDNPSQYDEKMRDLNVRCPSICLRALACYDKCVCTKCAAPAAPAAAASAAALVAAAVAAVAPGPDPTEWVAQSEEKSEAEDEEKSEAEGCEIDDDVASPPTAAPAATVAPTVAAPAAAVAAAVAAPAPAAADDADVSVLPRKG